VVRSSRRADRGRHFQIAERLEGAGIGVCYLRGLAWLLSLGFMRGLHRFPYLFNAGVAVGQIHFVYQMNLRRANRISVPARLPVADLGQHELVAEIEADHPAHGQILASQKAYAAPGYIHELALRWRLVSVQDRQIGVGLNLEAWFTSRVRRSCHHDPMLQVDRKTTNSTMVQVSTASSAGAL
jgi:hypothetical protein